MMLQSQHILITIPHHAALMYIITVKTHHHILERKYEYLIRGRLTGRILTDQNWIKIALRPKTIFKSQEVKYLLKAKVPLYI